MKIKSYIPLLCSILLIGSMIGAADIFGSREIIFPEIAAIATGALLTPKLAWRTDYLRTFTAIALCAGLGLCIVLWLPGAVWFKMCIAYLLASALFMTSGTSFAPMISAAVLPVLLQTDTIIYPIAACVLTAIILLLRFMLVKNGILEDQPFEKLPQPDTSICIQTFARWLIASAVIFIALKLGVRYAAAPPLLVAFTEFWKPETVSRKRPTAVITLITLCAVSGAGIRFVLTEWLFVPACVSAALTVIAVYFIMMKIGLMLPPASAIAILAFLIPKEALLLFPVQIMLGISVFVGASYLYHGKAFREMAAFRTMFQHLVR